MAEEVWDWQVDKEAQVAGPDTVSIGEVMLNPHVPGMVSIVIVGYNISYPMLHFTGNCIGSVKEHTDAVKTPYEIIYIDNGSTIKLGKEADYGVNKYMKNEVNKGVAYAWNQGIRVSSGDYICLLNNDAMVFDHWLEDLLEGLEHVDLIMATPMYGEPYSRAVESAKKREEWLARPYEESLSDFRDFSCVLTYKDVFASLGLFDEQFFMYNEDLDLMKRMDLAGLKYASTKRVNTFHIIGGTSNQSQELLDRTSQAMNESREKLKNKVYSDSVEPVKKEPEVWGEAVPTQETSPMAYTIDNPPTLIRTKETGDKVYLVRDKTAYWITKPEVLEALGYGFGSVVEVTKDLLYALDLGEQITMENVARFKQA